MAIIAELYGHPMGSSVSQDPYLAAPRACQQEDYRHLCHEAAPYSQSRARIGGRSDWRCI